jgi:hypothetical protein
LPPASANLVIDGNFSGLCSMGMQVTDAPLLNNHTEIPLFEITLINGLIPTVFQSELSTDCYYFL